MIPPRIHNAQAVRFSLAKGPYSGAQTRLAAKLYGKTWQALMQERHRQDAPALYRERAMDELRYAMRRGLDFYAASRFVAKRMRAQPGTVRIWAEQERMVRRAA